MTLDGYGATLAGGLGITFGIALASFLMATVLGAATAWASLSRSMMAQALASGYSALARGIPDYLLMLLVYFGGQVMMNRVRSAIGLGEADIAPAAAAVLALGLVFGAYMGEAIRGAWLAIPRAQLDAAAAAGLSSLRRLRRIALPQMAVHGLGAFTNVWLVLLKTTVVASLIGVGDLLRRTQAAASATQQPLKFYAVATLAFLVLTAASELLLRGVTARSRRGLLR